MIELAKCLSFALMLVLTLSQHFGAALSALAILALLSTCEGENGIQKS